MKVFHVAIIVVTAFIVWTYLLPEASSPYVAVIVIVGFIVWSLLQDLARTRQFRGYAQRAGLTYMGAALPGNFPMSKTSVYWGSVSNAVAGDRSGKELLIFDCRLGEGRGSRSQTVVAVRGPAESFGPARFQGWQWRQSTIGH